MKCDSCNEEEEDLTTCKDCGNQFCSECGDQRARLCNECNEGYVESLEDEVDETFIESTQMKEDIE